MAPVAELQKRTIYCNAYACYYTSAWNSWGRWVVLGVAFVIALIVAVLSMNYRRRLLKQQREVAQQQAQQFPMEQGAMAPGQPFDQNQNQNQYPNAPQEPVSTVTDEKVDNYAPPAGPPPVSYQNHP